MSFLELTQGPLWHGAATIFLVGVAWRLIGLIMLGKPRDLSRPNKSSLGGAIRAILIHSVPHGGNLGRTLYHFFSGYLFHVGLFVLLLFAAPHVAFINDRIVQVPWPAMPRWGFVLAAEAAFAGLILLYVRRIADPVMRKITTLDDHVGTWLVFLAMTTGCLAMLESHDGLRAFHMLSVELLMVYFPFSRLMHAFTFVFSRASTGATYGRRGFTP